MRLDISQKNYQMSDKLEDIIRKKTDKLSRYLSEDTVVKVMLKEEGEKQKLEMTINFEGTFVRSEVIGKNFYDLIDEALPKLERQLSKHKSRLKKKLKETAFKEPAFQGEEPALNPGVVRVKKFELIPMSLDTAIENLDMLGHDFYVFQDDQTHQICVLYRRDDGSLGILEPQPV